MTEIELTQLNNVVIAITIKDRKNKNKAMAGKWLGRGFKKLGRKRLLDYWQKRIDSNPEDKQLFKQILIGYERTVYGNMLKNKNALRVNLKDIAKEDLPKVLFSNYVEDSANRMYDDLLGSITRSFEQLLDVPTSSLDIAISITSKDTQAEKQLLDSITRRLEADVSERVRQLPLEDISKEEIDEALGKEAIENNYRPPLWKMAASAARAAKNFAKAGFKTVSDEKYEERLSICKACPFWNSKGFGSTGQCMKCGCATKAKLRLATEECPDKKWLATVS